MLDKDQIEYSKEIKIPIGEVCCPHCGIVVHGLVLPFCQVCERSYYTKEVLEYTLKLFEENKFEVPMKYPKNKEIKND